MRKKQSSKAIVVKLEKGQKSIVIPRDILEMVGFGDGSLILVEVLDGVIVLKSPTINFGKYVGLLSGRDKP